MSSVKILSNRSSSKMEGNQSFSEVAVNGNSNGTSNGGSASATKSNNKAVSGRRRFGENGFEEQGGYMAAKKAKLDNQFNTSVRPTANGSDGKSSEIFNGLSIYINGYTNPPEPELRELFIRHGGTFHPYNSTRTSYVIATNLSAPSKRLYSSKTLTPSWVMDSIATGKALDVRQYKLYDLNGENKQRTLSQFMGSKKPSVPQNEVIITLEDDDEDEEICEITSVASPVTVPNGNGNGYHQHPDDSNSQDHVSESEDEFFECSQEYLNKQNPPISDQPHPSTKYSNGTGRRESEEEAADDELQLDTNQKSISNGTNGSIVEENGSNHVNDASSDVELADDSESVPNGDARLGGKVKTATDEGFLEEFFSHSRLHLISEQKKEMQLLIGGMRKNIAAQTFPNLKKFESEVNSSSTFNEFSVGDNNKYLMHIDLDCFFVSVGLLSRPHLRGKPVVVTHSTGKGQDSKSDIACASYEARKFGVKNGMWVGDSKIKCPALEVIPYDFEEYRKVSKRFFEAVATVTLDIEPNSVDEMVVDVTSVLKNVPGSTPQSLAAFLRKIILEETRCPASIGIGSNRLLAKLAVKIGKPDGVHHLQDNDALSYIENLNVRDLPGVGWSNEDKLNEKFGVQTCGDLLKVPLKELKTVFGEKTAEKMHSLCQGIDSSEVKLGVERPKSLSVDVNFHIRFTKDDDVTNFIINICKELSGRAERIQAKAKNFTLKLMIRRKGAGDPLKPGGHGIVDSISRSRELLNPTRNFQELYKTACSLIRMIRVPPSDYRGVGVILTGLKFDFDETGKKSVQRTLTDMPLSRARQMLSISKKRARANSSATSSVIIAHDKDDENSPCDLSSSNSESSEPISIELSNSSVVNGERSVITSTTSSTSTTVEQQTGDKTSPVDISVLRSLPREIAEEQCQFYGISKDVLDQVDEPEVQTDENGVPSEGHNGETGNKALASYYDNIEEVDPSFLSALPDNIRQDVLIQMQESKGRRNINNIQEDGFDEQQPCSSRQAIERSKRLEEQRKAAMETSDNVVNENGVDLTSTSPEKENSPIKMNSLAPCPEVQPLEEQTTPIINYTSPKKAYDPVTFWDITVDYHVLPSQKNTLPGLNNCTEIADVRNLIRQGLEVVSDPTSDDVESLEKYFKELVANGWLNHTQVLLKFVQRRIIQLGETSQWTPILSKIIEDTQMTCKRLYHGVLDLES